MSNKEQTYQRLMQRLALLENQGNIGLLTRSIIIDPAFNNSYNYTVGRRYNHNEVNLFDGYYLLSFMYPVGVTTNGSDIQFWHRDLNIKLGYWPISNKERTELDHKIMTSTDQFSGEISKHLQKIGFSLVASEVSLTDIEWADKYNISIEMSVTEEFKKEAIRACKHAWKLRRMR
jgi:hypothetical protein